MHQKQKKVSVGSDLTDEIIRSIDKTQGWGSVEIFVQDGQVTQVTCRSIKKIRQAKPETTS